MESDDRAYSNLAERERGKSQRIIDKDRVMRLIKEYKPASPKRANKLLTKISRLISEMQ